MLKYQGLLGRRGYPRAAQAVAGIRCYFGAAWAVSASGGGAMGRGQRGAQTCGWGGWEHPSLWTWLWVSAAVGLPRQAARVGL